MDSKDGNVKIQKAGDFETVSSGSHTIEKIISHDYTQYIDNSKNKFTQLEQEIEFKGEQKPESQGFCFRFKQ